MRPQAAASIETAASAASAGTEKVRVAIHSSDRSDHRGSELSGPQVRLEEAQDPPPRVLRRRLMEPHAGDAQHRSARAEVVAVHERVAGFGVLANVVLDA